MVDCDFPGGNIIVDKIEGDTVFLQQDLRDTQGNWFYWYFRVQGVSGRTLSFNFTNGNVIGLPFGERWNTSEHYGSSKGCSHWADELDGIQLSAIFEIPYANVRGREVTCESPNSAAIWPEPCAFSSSVEGIENVTPQKE